MLVIDLSGRSLPIHQMQRCRAFRMGHQDSTTIAIPSLPGSAPPFILPSRIWMPCTSKNAKLCGLRRTSYPACSRGRVLFLGIRFETSMALEVVEKCGADTAYCIPFGMNFAGERLLTRRMVVGGKNSPHARRPSRLCQSHTTRGHWVGKGAVLL